MGTEEVGAADTGDGERGIVCPDVGDVLCCGGTGGSVVWVEDVGYVPAHWEDLGRLPPQGGPQTDGVATVEGTGGGGGGWVYPPLAEAMAEAISGC